MPHQTLIKINLEHNISSLKIPELKVDSQISVLALKEIIEKRYGSEPNYLKLALKSKEGNILTNMEEEMRSLDFYGVESGMTISVLDLNPNSIHKEIENTSQIEKYVMSEETYDSLPENFRKWKKSFLEDNPQTKNPLTNQTEICDPNYMKSLSETLSVGQRCQLENGMRGEIKYIGKVIDIGFGFYIGVELDEAIEEGGNGTLDSTQYFETAAGKAVFVRPNKVEAGDFPKIEANDEI